MGNLFTTEKQLPVRRDPLRQNRRNNPPPLFSFSTIVVPIGHRKGILIRQCLEDNDPNTRTSRTSSINRCSNRLGYSVTYVMSRRRERPGMDESRVVRSSALRKRQEKDFSIAWILTASSTTCVPSKVALVETKLILHCLVTWKFHTCGVSTFVTLVLLSLYAFYYPFRLQEEKIQKKEDKEYSSQPSILWPIFNKNNTTTWQNHERYSAKPSGKCSRMQKIGSIWEMLKIKD